MAEIPYSAAKGEDLYDGTTDFNAMNDAYDSTADNPYLFNAKDRAQFRDMLEYSRTQFAANANFANTVETSSDVNPATPYIMYMVDASGGHRTVTLPNAAPGDKKWFSVTQIQDGNHVEITTVGGSQTFGQTGLTSIGVFTCGSTLILSTNTAGDGYDAVIDTRSYLRVVDQTTDLDLSTGGYEGGAIYLCAPPIGTNITITLPESGATHRGVYAKFVLSEGVGGYGTVVVQEPISGLDEEIVVPGKGFEIMDDGAVYHITQDSRSGAQTISIFQYATTADHRSQYSRWIPQNRSYQV